jgi:hypothetical protein
MTEQEIINAGLGDDMSKASEYLAILAAVAIFAIMSLVLAESLDRTAQIEAAKTARFVGQMSDDVRQAVAR